MDKVFLSRSDLKKKIWLPPLTIGKEEQNASLPAFLVNLRHLPILVVSWCFPKRQMCSQKIAFSGYIHPSDGPLNHNLQTYVLSYLLRENTICEHCMMPIPFHMTNFISRLGVIRFVCKKTGDPNSLLGDDSVIWKWERSRPDLNGPLVEVTSQRTKVSREECRMNFKLLLQTLLIQCTDKLQFYGVANWTCCYWYERERIYSIIPPRTLATDANPNYHETRHGTHQLLLKYGSFGSENNYTRFGIDFDPSRDLRTSDDELGKFISAALLYLDGNENGNYREVHPRISSNLCSGFEFSITCYHAKGFHDLRSSLAFEEGDYIESLQKCKRWNAQGGKSKAVFIKTEDERLILKEIQDIEFSRLELIAPKYFAHLEKCTASGTPSYLVAILGLYLVRRRVGSKTTAVKLIVMQNLMVGYDNHVTYDLKGCRFSRYVSSSDASVLQDGNYMMHMSFWAIFLSQAAKTAFETSLRLDTSFLEVNKIMDYSLLLVLDREQKVVTMGIIDYLRYYSLDKSIECQLKSLFLRHQPTVVPPDEYRTRFIEAATNYFLVIPGR